VILIDSMLAKINSIINMDKRKKIYVVGGGIWGLINQIIYIVVLYACAFAGTNWKYISTQIPAIWKIIFLPAYLTHQLIFIPLLELESLLPVSSSSLSIRIFFLILLLVAIVMPILFGIGISLLAANLINKGKKALKK